MTRWISLSAVMVSIFLSSCATYENATLHGRWRDVTRADIAAAVAAVRADPQLKRASNKLIEIEVVSRDEIHLIWASKEDDMIERAHGKWRYVITRIFVG